MTFGKWSIAGVPHSGWEWVNIRDLFEDSAGEDIPLRVCEMCERQEIRFIHTMRHADYHTVLEVGCVCAGKMGGNSRGAEDREKACRKRTASRERRRKSWLKHWRLNRNGNYVLRKCPEASGTVFRFGSKWKVLLNLPGGQRAGGSCEYTSPVDAQVAALKWLERKAARDRSDN